MSIEGELVVRVETEGGRVRRASASSERPRVARRIFGGRPAGEAAPLAGSLFAICGRSQAIAAAGAVESARGDEAPARVQEARAIRVAAETIHEHAWRLLVDWRKLSGREADVAGISRARQALSPLLAAEGEEPAGASVQAAIDWGRHALFGVTPGAFLALDTLDEFLAWTRAAGTGVAALAGSLAAEFGALGASPVPLLAPADDALVARELGPAIAREANFEGEPNWYGQARETGPIARTMGHPLVGAAQAAWGRAVGARVVARLVDLALAFQALSGDGVARHGACGAGSGAGLGWVETSRGLLVHRAELADGKIADYRIVAPTEWNFHPSGAFARGAKGLAAGDAVQLERCVRWLVASLDPCVGVRLEVGHA
jgi:hypothetical protein